MIECRIVAKVDELMALVDALETQLATARTTTEKLMEAVVAELTYPAIDTERSMSSSIIVAGIDVGGNKKGFHAVALQAGDYLKRIHSRQSRLPAIRRYIVIAESLNALRTLGA
jgi:hypothetical protein